MALAIMFFFCGDLEIFNLNISTTVNRGTDLKLKKKLEMMWQLCTTVPAVDDLQKLGHGH